VNRGSPRLLLDGQHRQPNEGKHHWPHNEFSIGKILKGRTYDVRSSQFTNARPSMACDSRQTWTKSENTVFRLSVRRPKPEIGVLEVGDEPPKGFESPKGLESPKGFGFPKGFENGEEGTAWPTGATQRHKGKSMRLSGYTTRTFGKSRAVDGVDAGSSNLGGHV
jgi:hypothetical protein